MKKSSEIKINIGQLINKTECHSTYLGFRLDSGRSSFIKEWNLVWRAIKRKRKTPVDKKQDEVMFKKYNPKVNFIKTIKLLLIIFTH